MASQPGRDLAAQLDIKPRTMITQLTEWTPLAFLARTGPGRYALSRAARAGRSVSRRCRRTARFRTAGHHRRNYRNDGGSGSHARSLATPAGAVSRTRGHPASPTARRPSAQVRSRSGPRKRCDSKPFPARQNGYPEQETAYRQQS